MQFFRQYSEKYRHYTQDQDHKSKKGEGKAALVKVGIHHITYTEQ